MCQKTHFWNDSGEGVFEEFFFWKNLCREQFAIASCSRNKESGVREKNAGRFRTKKAPKTGFSFFLNFFLWKSPTEKGLL